MLQELLNQYALDPRDTQKIYDLAVEYDRIGQGTAAVTFYLRTAELEEENKVLQYKSLINAGHCFNRQGRNYYTVLGLYKNACNILPDRPEAHFFLADLHIEKEKWLDVVMHSSLGLMFSDAEDIGLDYPGIGGLLYHKAFGKWKTDDKDEAEKAEYEFFDLAYRLDVDQETKMKALNMLRRVNYPDMISYKKEDAENFKFPFVGIETIEHNYSKHFQDMFVLACFDGKRDGTYLEIGGGDPFLTNNTALLEEQFGWRGVSIDNSKAFAFDFSKKRKNPCLCIDALQTDYAELFETHCYDNVIDYLQVDCDEVSLDILKRLPFDTHKFGVVTFEHDCYRFGDEFKNGARSIMEENGYILLVENLAFAPGCPYEDWFVHPDVVDIKPEMYAKGDANFVWDYMVRSK